MVWRTRVVYRGSRWTGRSGNGRPFRKRWGSKSGINQVGNGCHVIMPLPSLMLLVVEVPNLLVLKRPPQRRGKRYRCRIAWRRHHLYYRSLGWPFRKGTRRRDQRLVVVAHHRDGREDVTKVDFGYRFVCLKFIVQPQTGHRRNDVGSPPPRGYLRTRRTTKSIASTMPGTP